MKNSFIFDFDGTIAETIPITLKAIEAAYADNGLPVPSDAEIVAHFGANEYGMFLKMTPDHADELFEAYIREFVAVHQKFPQKPFDGIVAAIRKIKDAGWKIGLVTGKHIRAAEKSIEIYGLSGLFDDIRCGGINGSIKTQNISELLDIWAIAPQNTWYIGDVVSDVIDSRAAGVHPLSAAWTHANLTELAALKAAEPEEIFTSVESFNKWLDGLLVDKK